MIRLNPREYRLLSYAMTECPDLSREKLAVAAGVVPVSVGRILTRLQNRDLITVQRGLNRRILSITPIFEFNKGKTFWVGNPLRSKPL